MRRQFWSLLIVSIFFFSNLSCKKEQPTNLPPPEFPNIPNTPPKAYAGQDIWIVLPTTNCIVTASAIDNENNISSYLWTRVSGPASHVIDKPNSSRTEISKLEKGNYEFEVLVTDKGGLSSKDTVTVFVREPAALGPGQVIFKDVKWMCPMGCTLLIDCFSCIVPVNQSFKVYLKRDNTNQWHEVVPYQVATDNDKYFYGITDNSLWIYGVFASDEELETPDIMITF